MGISFSSYFRFTSLLSLRRRGTLWSVCDLTGRSVWNGVCWEVGSLGIWFPDWTEFCFESFAGKVGGIGKEVAEADWGTFLNYYFYIIVRDVCWKNIDIFDLFLISSVAGERGKFGTYFAELVSSEEGTLLTGNGFGFFSSIADKEEDDDTVTQMLDPESDFWFFTSLGLTPAFIKAPKLSFIVKGFAWAIFVCAGGGLCGCDWLWMSFFPWNIKYVCFNQC